MGLVRNIPILEIGRANSTQKFVQKLLIDFFLVIKKIEPFAKDKNGDQGKKEQRVHQPATFHQKVEKGHVAYNIK